MFRFNVLQTGRGQEEVVPSSNPASQCSISTTDALWLLDGVVSSTTRSPWEESFSPCTPDKCCDGENSVLFSVISLLYCTSRLLAVILY